MAQEQLPKRAANIFVNYRRDDSSGHAGRLFDRLSDRFPGRVFMDVDTIEPGIDFAELIEQAVNSCEVLIVVIGREWLDLRDTAGRRRLDSPNDFVRLEISAALERRIRVIPVLVQGASMPQPEDLPPDLVKLTRRNAIELSDARWGFDVDRLIQTIEGVLQEKAPSALLPAAQEPKDAPSWAPAPASAPAPEKTRTLAWLIPAALVLLILVGWGGWRLGHRPDDSQDEPQKVAESTGQSAGEAAPVASAPESPATLVALPPVEQSTVEQPPAPEAKAETQPATKAEPATKTEPEPRPAPVAPPPARTSVEEPETHELEAEGSKYGPNACKEGFVWREARSGDRICVTPETRRQVVEDNRKAKARRDPADPDRCLPGYVWREAFGGDRTCVPPESRDQALLDNSLAGERRMSWAARKYKASRERLKGNKDKG